MRYTLHCCRCNQSFLFDFSKSETIPDACPHCHERFDQYDFSTVNTLLDKMDSYNTRLTSLRIKRAFEPTAEELSDTPMDDKVFSSDIQRIIHLYENAKGEHRELLTNIIDKLYLLLNRDIRSSSVDLLSSQRVYDLLSQEFERGIAEQNQKMLEFLTADS